MLIALSILVGVAFWVWVIDEVTSDDDDKSSSSEAETEETTDEIRVGEGENDLLIGTENPDNLDGGAGYDMAFGLEGNDTLSGGSEDDILLGGQNDDMVQGGSGDDILVGGEGVDTLIGNSGSDIIDGTSSLDEDALLASAQTAETADDLEFAFSSDPDTDAGDQMEGRGGDDWLIMGSEDSASGGSGSDLFEGGDWITPGEPAIIEDYNEAEDQIVYSYDGSGLEPTITTSVDGATGDATVFADGEEVMIVLAAGPTFNSGNVILLAA